ncbi:MAG: C40 family peptidase [Flavitalea sp.]
MNDAVCCVPVSPLRAEPSHRSEITSQQVFGEQCVILERAKDNWAKVRCRYDNYEGWCQEYHLQPVESVIESSGTLTREWNNLLFYKGEPMQVPFGSQIPGLVNGVAQWGDAIIEYDGELADPRKQTFTEDEIKRVAKLFLNTSYLWGGKSIYGIDCSGFCQTVFKYFNIALMRDAYQQATQGEVVGFLQEARCGDLAFFDNEEGRITHVGILLNDHRIIHSSAKVRIDPIDNMGIINHENRERTHKLRIIRRYV